MEKAKPVGRALRLLIGLAILFYVVPIYFKAGFNFQLASLEITVGLILFYIVVHYLVSQYFSVKDRFSKYFPSVFTCTLF